MGQVRVPKRQQLRIARRCITILPVKVTPAVSKRPMTDLTPSVRGSGTRFWPKKPLESTAQKRFAVEQNRFAVRNQHAFNRPRQNPPHGGTSNPPGIEQ